jgi:hypothetical protein
LVAAIAGTADTKPPPGSTAAAVAAIEKVLSDTKLDTVEDISKTAEGTENTNVHRAYSQHLLDAALEVASSSLADKLSAASGDSVLRAQGAASVKRRRDESEKEDSSVKNDILRSNPHILSGPLPLKSLETLFDLQDLKRTDEGMKRLNQGDSSAALTDHETKSAKHERVAPKRNEIKVRSKEGLKSFLLTTERVLAVLVRATKEAKDKYVRDTSSNASWTREELPDVLGMSGSDAEALLFNLLRVQDVLNRGAVSGVSGKLQIKAESWAPVAINHDSPNGIVPMRATKLEVILKWGGALTPLGEAQAEYLGETLRKSLYPDPKGGGVLRLHSTFRHDLKIRTSDEGRVMQTAASFAKGLLQLEGPLTPILVSLVRKETGSLHMLDHAGNEAVKIALEKCKKELHRLLHIPGQLSLKRLNELAPAGNISVRNSLTRMSNPTETLQKLFVAVGELVSELDVLLVRAQMEDTTYRELYMRESLLLLVHRWRKLHKDLHNKKKAEFDLSKVCPFYSRLFL